MNDLEQPPFRKRPQPRPALPASDRDTASPPTNTIRAHRRSGRQLLGVGVLVLFVSALALGVWWHYQQHRQVMDTDEDQTNFVPSVRVEKVLPRLGRLRAGLDPPAMFVGIGADHFDLENSPVRSRCDLAPCIPRHCQRVDRIGDHYLAQSQICLGQSVSHQVPGWPYVLSQHLGRPQGLLDRVDPQVCGMSLLCEGARERCLTCSGKAAEHDQHRLLY
jgi:hypothetical protein